MWTNNQLVQLFRRLEVSKRMVYREVQDLSIAASPSKETPASAIG